MLPCPRDYFPVQEQQLFEALLYLKRLRSHSMFFEKKKIKTKKADLPISFWTGAGVMILFNPFFLEVFPLVSKGLEVILKVVVFPGCLWTASLPSIS